MLIQAYGEFWLANEVYWGKGGKGQKGRLLGIPAHAKNSEHIDLWDQHGIYVLFQDFDPVYVGQTYDQGLGKRLRDHWRSIHKHGRWNRFSWYGMRKINQSGKLGLQVKGKFVTVSESLDMFEALLISTMEPHLNKKGGNFGKDVDRYIQVPYLSNEEEIEPISLEDFSKGLIKRIDKLIDSEKDRAKRIDQKFTRLHRKISRLKRK